VRPDFQAESRATRYFQSIYYAPR